MLGPPLRHALLLLPTVIFARPGPALGQLHGDFLRIGARDINKGEFGFPNHLTPLKEYQQALEMDVRIQRQVDKSGNAELTGYVGRLAEQIQRRSDLKGPLWLRLTRSQEHLAFSTLAGRAYIDEKLVRIAENESQLAGAIAHEVAHLAARHGAENISRMRLLDANPSGFLTLLRPCLTIGNPFTSGGTDGFWQAVCYFNEIEADELATQYLWNSGFDPEGLLNLLSVLQDHNWLDAPPGPSQTSSHPPISVRQKRIRIQLKKLPGLEAARLDSSDFQEAREQTRANGVPLSRK
ncbi:MAG: hypothetical protein DMG10_03860 [Acidobacteria bacterium]|nr:MAG: hypothetical protein DMG10_03860 [Acidobacteriota bacterium]